MTRKWIEVNDLFNGKYSVKKNTRIKFSILSSDLCDYSDTYIVVKETIDLLASTAIENDSTEMKVQKDLGFKNKAPFRSYI